MARPRPRIAIAQFGIRYRPCISDHLSTITTTQKRVPTTVRRCVYSCRGASYIVLEIASDFFVAILATRPEPNDTICPEPIIVIRAFDYPCSTFYHSGVLSTANANPSPILLYCTVKILLPQIGLCHLP